MKKAKRIWNYIDMFLQAILITGIVIFAFYVCLNLEKYFYRYTIFPIFALISIFIMGTLFGRNLERTRKFKPVGVFSKIMNKSRKQKNSFIFKDDEETYLPKKKMIEEIKSGNISHIKQYKDSEITYDANDFKDIYSIDIDDIIDKETVEIDIDSDEEDQRKIELEADKEDKKDVIELTSNSDDNINLNTVIRAKNYDKENKK